MRSSGKEVRAAAQRRGEEKTTSSFGQDVAGAGVIFPFFAAPPRRLEKFLRACRITPRTTSAVSRLSTVNR